MTTPADISHIRDSATAASRSEVSLARTLELIRDTPFPRVLPAYTDLLVSSDGRLWARSFAYDTDAATWHVFGVGGQLIASVLIPAGVQPIEISSGVLLAKHVSVIGVETIRLHQLPAF